MNPLHLFNRLVRVRHPHPPGTRFVGDQSYEQRGQKWVM